MQLVAQVGGQTDVNCVGQGPESLQAVHPPAAPDATVSLQVLRDAEEEPSRMAWDVRRGAARQQRWTVAVTTPRAGEEVTLSWPDLNVSLPAEQRMTLIDLDSGERRSLATTSNYRFRSTEQPRLFELVYEPASPAGALVISNLTVQSSRAIGPAAFSFHLNSDAATTVAITSLSGHPVRILEEQFTRAAGHQKVSWAYEDERGAPVPNGPYLVRVRAVDAEGQGTQTVRMVTVAP